MIVRLVSRNGTVSDAHGSPGDKLLDLAQAYGMPLEGTCGGQMACSTCHVVIDPDDFPTCRHASVEEEDMLDFAPGAVRTSRLACQIVLDDTLDGMTVRMPG